MVDKKFIEDQMRESYNESQQKVGFKGTSKLDDFIYNQTFASKIIEKNKDTTTKLNREEISYNIKKI